MNKEAQDAGTDIWRREGEACFFRDYVLGQAAALVSGSGQTGWSWVVKSPDGTIVAEGCVRVRGRVGREHAQALCDVLLGHMPKKPYVARDRRALDEVPYLLRGQNARTARNYFSARSRIPPQHTHVLAAQPREVRSMLWALALKKVLKDERVSYEQACAELGLATDTTGENWLKGGSFPGALKGNGMWTYSRKELEAVKKSLAALRARDERGDLTLPDENRIVDKAPLL